MAVARSKISTGSASNVDLVNHPPHYTSHPSGVECIEVTHRLGFALGNAVKYVWRHGKTPNDLAKARWYVDYLLSDPGLGAWGLLSPLDDARMTYAATVARVLSHPIHPALACLLTVPLAGEGAVELLREAQAQLP